MPAKTNVSVFFVISLGFVVVILKPAKNFTYEIEWCVSMAIDTYLQIERKKNEKNKKNHR